MTTVLAKRPLFLDVVAKVMENPPDFHDTLYDDEPDLR